MTSKQLCPTCSGSGTKEVPRRYQDKDGKTHTVYDSEIRKQCDGSGWVNR